MSIDIHSKDFDEGTQIKLKVYEKYLINWISITRNSKKKLRIFDFFSGPGYDNSGNLGSPIIAIDVVRSMCSELRKSGTSVDIIFNDKSTEKINKLKENCTDRINNCCESKNCDKNCPLAIEYLNDDFKNVLNDVHKYLQTTKDSFNLMFIDQYGINAMNTEVFGKILKLKSTDTIFFTSSAHAYRFFKSDEFKRHIDLTQFIDEETNYNDCHRKMCEYYRSLVPENYKYHLAPFSIRKPQTGSIYGLIYGSTNLKGINAFLDVAWSIDPMIGEANFDIDDEAINKDSLFFDLIKPKKMEKFKESLVEYLHTERTNQEVYEYTLLSGFIPKHTNAILRSKDIADRIKVTAIYGSKPRKGAYYLEYRPSRYIRIRYE